jgi:8-oxo-dGTP pyrophosphatase MutT (NUDIX family)
MNELVRAAGGVVARRGPLGPEVLIVHRPRYDDWSIPKGKREAGESDEMTALREVAEETGYQCRLGEMVGTTEYVDHRGRPKIVVFFLMTVVAGDFQMNDEVDEIRWLDAATAAQNVTQQGERTVLALASPLLTALV